MTPFDHFFVQHSVGNIRFISFRPEKGEFLLTMHDLSVGENEESSIHYFTGNNLSECIENAQIWIDDLLDEDRTDKENATDEQEEENTI